MPNDICKYLNRPVAVGARTVANRLLLSPMAGLTHVAFRELTAEYGGYGLLFTEMCSARALPNENPAVSPVFRWREAELAHLVCQLFGSEPDMMATAARRVEAKGFFGVDINFGCSVAAICKQNAGAALLKEPERAAAIVDAVRKAVCLPVFVKFRIGWADAPASAVEAARRFEAAGADALVFHPRVAPDRRSRPPKWDYIGRVKAAVSIPVFGNGEVFSVEDAGRMVAQTGCDGISLGRIAMARPWIFAEWTAGFEADSGIYHRCAKRMMALLAAHYEPVTALRRFKKWAVFFTAGFKYGHRFSAMLRGAKDIESVYRTLGDIFETAPETAGRPNMNLFR